jgi:hypothetical protein
VNVHSVDTSAIQRNIKRMPAILFVILNTSPHECWSVLCPSAPIYGKLGLKFRNQLQFKCDSEQNTFSNLTLASEANLCTCVEIVQHSAENRKSALSHFRRKLEIEHSSAQGTTLLLKLIVLNICSAVTIWSVKQKLEVLNSLTSFSLI